MSAVGGFFVMIGLLFLGLVVERPLVQIANLLEQFLVDYERRR